MAQSLCTSSQVHSSATEESGLNLGCSDLGAGNVWSPIVSDVLGRGQDQKKSTSAGKSGFLSPPRQAQVQVPQPQLVVCPVLTVGCVGEGASHEAFSFVPSEAVLDFLQW